MSERALGFVEEWVSEHVTAADAAGDSQARAKALASQCLAEANAQGIPAAEINDAIDDLTAFMSGAIEEASERKEHDSDFETDEEIEVLVNPDSFENAAEDAAEDDDDEKQ
jgi:membrane-bound lytic murein transglycosylase B